MKQIFYIENATPGNGQQVLSICIGEKHCSFALTDRSAAAVYELGYFTADEWNDNELTALFSAYPSLSNSFNKVEVMYDLPRAELLASNICKEEDAGLFMNIAGKNAVPGNIIIEPVTGWQLDIVYAVPSGIHEWMQHKFPGAHFHHQYSLAIKNGKTVNREGSLLVDFRQEDFTVIAVKENKCLLARSFSYATPADVLYYLLKISQQFSLSQQELLLQLSGLIDRESSLYKELIQYFIHIEFRDAEWSVKSEYPAHFFTSLNDLAKCAS